MVAEVRSSVRGLEVALLIAATATGIWFAPVFRLPEPPPVPPHPELLRVGDVGKDRLCPGDVVRDVTPSSYCEPWPALPYCPAVSGPDFHTCWFKVMPDGSLVNVPKSEAMGGAHEPQTRGEAGV